MDINEKINQAALARRKKYVDDAIIGYAGNPELEKLSNDATMEALRDRIVIIGFEHLHVDYEPSYLFSQLATMCNQGTIPKDLQTKLTGTITIGTTTVEEPFYQGHPCGTMPPLIEKCTCDITSLMMQGCKCGFLEVEKNQKKEEATPLSSIW